MDLLEENNSESHGSRHFWELAKVKFLLKITAQYLNDSENIIDIGCGDCFIVSEFARRYPSRNFAAVDQALTQEAASQIAARLAHDQLPVRIFNSPDELWSKFNADTVFMFDVLEHIKDDAEYLKKLIARQEFAAGGLLCLTVPAYQQLFSAHDRFLKHFRRYSRKQLQKVATNAGFEIIESGYFFFSLLPLRYLQKTIEKFKQPEDSLKGVGKVSGHDWLNALAGKILMLDACCGYLFKKINIQMPGLSCYLICRKPLS